jgi:glycosyltransferase involved in cell wall biosynthesis
VAARHATSARERSAGATPGRLRRWLVPDLHVGWSALAAPMVAMLAATRSVDVVYTTCPPYSAHAPGLLARALGVPWVADFRDGWNACPTRLDFPTWRRRLERRMEDLVLERADRVIFASDAARDHAIARVPDLASRCETILTGFDRSEFERWRDVAPTPERFEIVHAGSVCVNHMEPAFCQLLAALRSWSDTEADVSRTTRVRFVGAEPRLSARIDAFGLDSWVAIEPAVPRAELGRRLRSADACLALTASKRFGSDPIPGKTFDAAGAGRPLLALTPGGALAELVDRLGLGVSIDPHDEIGMIGVLERWRRCAVRGTPLPGPLESSRSALENGRAMARIRSVLESAARREEVGETCPFPSAS